MNPQIQQIITNHPYPQTGTWSVSVWEKAKGSNTCPADLADQESHKLATRHWLGKAAAANNDRGGERACQTQREVSTGA